MKLKKMIALALALATCTSLLAGCGKKEGDASGSQGGTGEYRDTLVLAAGMDQNCMDGQMNNTNDTILRAVYSQLVRRNADNKIEGDLAEDWSVSEDGCTWTFHLKKGVKFHSGKELTSADVKASYDRLLAKDSPVRYSSLVQGYIKECNAPDPYTVELVTPSPVAPMLANLCHRSNLILNADYIEKYGMDLGLTVESVDGTGPYRLTSWDPNREMTLERFDDYFKGAVPTENVEVMIVPDANARLMGLQTGELDVAIVSASDVNTVREDDDLTAVPFDGIGSYGLQFNCANEFMADPKCRQAVSLAINRQAIVDTLLKDIAMGVSTCPVNPLVWGYNDLGVIEQDLEKSKALLAEAGYPNGFEITIMVMPGYNKALEATEMVVSDLAKVGITAKIETVDGATFKSYMGNRSQPGENFPYAMMYMGYGAGTADCDEGLRRIWTTSPDGNNNNNYGWYSNARVDELLAQAAVEMDEAKRMEMYKEAEQILFLEDPAAIWLYDSYDVWCMNKKVEGFKQNVNTVIFWEDLRVAK